MIQNHFSPHEKQALMEKVKLGVANVADFALKLFFRLLQEFRKFKSLEDFKRAVLLPLLEELVCAGVPLLIKLIKIAFF